MHFAYPPRKSSDPPPFRPRSSRSPFLRRSRLRTVALVIVSILGLLWILSGSSGLTTYTEYVPTGNPPVVIVTVVDPTSYSTTYLQTIQENRKSYAALHGYEVFLAKAHDYDTAGYQKTWSKIMAVRHALAQYPDCKYVWYLDQDSFIMEPSRTVSEVVTEPRTLESLMIRDYPIVPPDSIIKTFKYNRGENVDLIISQDKDGLVSDSMLLKNGDWAKFLTETWLDPLYRTYNFQKAERHALEHIVQWHPTILSQIALVPQRTMASYTHTNLGEGYREGDFVAMLKGCAMHGDASCEKEGQGYFKKFQEALSAAF